MWTDVNSKAELDVGGGYIRLNSEASLTLTNVSDQTVQLELDQGTLELTVRYLGPGQVYEVDTANLAFTVTKAGVYRFDAFPKEDATWVTVRKGPGRSYWKRQRGKGEVGRAGALRQRGVIATHSGGGSIAGWFRRLGQRSR